MSKPFKFTEAEIKERFIDLCLQAQNFCALLVQEIAEHLEAEGVSLDPPPEIIVNTRRMYLIIVSAYLDIERYKNFHQDSPNDEVLDAVKRCAFFMKWILRFKPLMLLRPENVPTSAQKFLDRYEFVNKKIFAINQVLIHMGHALGCQFTFSGERMEQLLYEMLYREITVDGWIAFFQTIKDIDPSKNQCSFLVLTT